MAVIEAKQRSRETGEARVPPLENGDHLRGLRVSVAQGTATIEHRDWVARLQAARGTS